jgi:hypothetical protein
VDPQILADVIDDAYLLPGPSELRAMRVDMFQQSLVNVDCGGKPLPLSNTAGRNNQSRYADLPLIAQKGLGEMNDPVQKLLVEGPKNCGAKLLDALPSQQDWANLGAQWGDLTQAAVQSGPVRQTLPEVTSCLREKSGLEVDPQDPTTSFLLSVDGDLYGQPSRAASQQEAIRLGKIYATCAAPFFDTLQAQLEKQRPALIERNRELLERFAGELAAAGYVP